MAAEFSSVLGAYFVSEVPPTGYFREESTLDVLEQLAADLCSPSSPPRYCPDCKTDSSEVIAAGEKMRLSKKKAGMMSKKQGCNRDWGKVVVKSSEGCC